MEHFLTVAEAANSDLMKFVVIGIIIFIASIGQILKKLGFDDSKQNQQPKARGGNSRPNTSRIDEDMENARRRLQEMIKERQGKSLNPDFPQAPKPVLYEQEPKEVLAPKPAPPVEAVYANTPPAFDYNSDLENAEKLMQESMIAKHSHSEIVPKKAISDNEIKDLEISDLIHNKKFLKKSIVISEILDKPLSLR